MPCYHPIKAWRSKDGKNLNNKVPLVFTEIRGEGLPLSVPCGRCIGCHAEKAKQWAIRCIHESQCHQFNYFVTLTYDDEHLDKKCGIWDEQTDSIESWSINKVEFVLFMKRLRKEFGNGIKFYHSAEYGGSTGRPHHHACIFGLEVNDLVPWKNTKGGMLYTSEVIKGIWGNGYVVLGNVTAESAAYVTRYVMQKVKGSVSESYYNGREPEYSTMSRRPGIGRRWAELYGSNQIMNGKVILKSGLTMRAPRYYDKYVEQINPDRMEEIKSERELSIDRRAHSPAQLAIKEEQAKTKLKLFGGRKSC